MPIILMIIGLVLIIYNYRSIKREEKNSIENNSSFSFQNILRENKEDLSDYKLELGILRKDIAESLTELQEDIIELKKDLDMLKNDKDVYENKKNAQNYDEDNQPKDNKEDSVQINFNMNNGVISEIKFEDNIKSAKTESIKRLLLEGLTEEQICHELSVSKGEVLLVQGLFKK